MEYYSYISFRIECTAEGSLKRTCMEGKVTSKCLISVNMCHYLGFVSLQFRDIVLANTPSSNTFGRDRFLARGNIKVIDIFINTAWVASKDLRKNKIKVILDMEGLKILPTLVQCTTQTSQRTIFTLTDMFNTLV